MTNGTQDKFMPFERRRLEDFITDTHKKIAKKIVTKFDPKKLTFFLPFYNLNNSTQFLGGFFLRRFAIFCTDRQNN
jgi:hypothetical protein